MLGGLAETRKRRCAFWVACWGERERPFEARQGGSGVQAEGAFPCQAEEAQGGRLQVCCLL